jgi:hypothetical protein
MVDKWVGDQLPPKRAAGSTRFYFVKNANGIRYGALGGEMDKVCSKVSEGKIIDVLVYVAETSKLDTKNPF